MGVQLLLAKSRNIQIFEIFCTALKSLWVLLEVSQLDLAANTRISVHIKIVSVANEQQQQLYIINYSWQSLNSI